VEPIRAIGFHIIDRVKSSIIRDSNCPNLEVNSMTSSVCDEIYNKTHCQSEETEANKKDKKGGSHLA
jgi:hypothetical protein